MREIKFRAWEPNWKMMFYSDHTDLTRCGKGFELYPFAIPVDNGEGPPNDVPGVMVLMQFTGLRDKNGKEIYEGDLVRWFRGEGCVPAPLEIIREVYWDEQSAGFLPFINDGCEGSGDYSLWLEVIGNIHENPGLIG